MGIKLGSNFDLEAAEFLDSRNSTENLQTLTKTYNLTNTPDGFEVYVKGSGKYYQASITNDILIWIERKNGDGKNMANSNLELEEPRKHTGKSMELAMPLKISNEDVSFSNLKDKEIDSSYDRLLVIDSQGRAGFVKKNNKYKVFKGTLDPPTSAQLINLGASIGDYYQIQNVEGKTLQLLSLSLGCYVVDKVNNFLSEPRVMIHEYVALGSKIDTLSVDQINSIVSLLYLD